MGRTVRRRRSRVGLGSYVEVVPSLWEGKYSATRKLEMLALLVHKEAFTREQVSLRFVSPKWVKG